jgi:hypothetical protein
MNSHDLKMHSVNASYLNLYHFYIYFMSIWLRSLFSIHAFAPLGILIKIVVLPFLPILFYDMQK